ncbi:12422_t:CDS:1, partial [Racocetra persica]
VNENSIEIKGSKYKVSEIESQEPIGMEGGKGFLLEGGLYKKEIRVEGIKVSLTGSYETLNSIKKDDSLLVLDKERWESESPFAILASGQEGAYQRKGLVGFSGKAEVEKLESIKGTKKENLIIEQRQELQNKIEIPPKGNIN